MLLCSFTRVSFLVAGFGSLFVCSFTFVSISDLVFFLLGTSGSLTGRGQSAPLSRPWRLAGSPKRPCIDGICRMETVEILTSVHPICFHVRLAATTSSMDIQKIRKVYWHEKDL